MEQENNTTEKEYVQKIRFGTLVYKSLPEIIIYQVFSSLILFISSSIISFFISMVADTTGHALTTGNIREMLLTWRTPVLIILGFFLVFCYVMLEIIVQIFLYDDILNGRRSSLWKNIKKGFGSLRKFMNPSGIGLLMFVLFAVPLCGLGLSVSLTSSFYIPNFIFDFIRRNPFLLVGYYALIVFFIVKAYFWIFSFHGVLLDGLSPKMAKKRSKELLHGNHLKFILKMVVIFAVLFLIRYIISQLGEKVIEPAIESSFADVSSGYYMDNSFSALNSTEARVIEYRIISCIYVFLFTYVTEILSLLAGSYVMLRLTRFYQEFKGQKEKRWLPRPEDGNNWWKILIIVCSFVIFIVLAIPGGFYFDDVFVRDDNVKIIAHRCGGNMASENSLEGIEAAIEHRCYGSEADIQRTKDGYYILNHDNTFKRIAGVDKSSDEMTLEEIRKMKIPDTTGSGGYVNIPTLEEALDAVRGEELLYIEFKGPTSDEQMADDVVKIIRDRGMVDNVVLVSLKSALIDYTETKYPEFETGVLIFAGIGNVAKMNCDDIIMEEEMSTRRVMDNIHKAGKKAIVWTVNQESFLQKFLDSDADAVITDEVELAEKVQGNLDTRTDLQILKSKIMTEDGWRTAL